MQENKEYREFKDKDVSEIYNRYRQLFGDNYEGDKYATTPSLFCKKGLAVFEDHLASDHLDIVSADGEGSASSDEGEGTTGTASMSTSNARNGDKRKSSTKGRKGKQKKISARELSYSVDRATSATEEVAAKLISIINPNENVGAAAVAELFAAGRLQRRSPLYCYTCTILMQKRCRDMFAVMKDADEKFEWIEWQFNERGKSLH